MRSLLLKLWADDKGAVVAPEVLLIVSLTVIGIIPGLIALRNCENASLATMGNALLALQTGFSFAPFTITSSAGATIATVNGGFYSVTGNTVLISSSVGTTDSFAQTAVNPAP